MLTRKRVRPHPGAVLPSSATLGARVRRARKALGMTQDELAGREFSKSFISQLERGTVNPSLESLRILANRLRLPIGHLLAARAGEYTPGELLDLAEAMLAYGRTREALRYLEMESTERNTPPDPQERARWLRLRGMVASHLGQSEGESWLQQAAEQAATAGAAWEQVLALQALGGHYAGARLYLKAARAFDEALQGLRQFWPWPADDAAPMPAATAGGDSAHLPRPASWLQRAAVELDLLARLAQLQEQLNDPAEATRLREDAQALRRQLGTLQEVGGWLSHMVSAEDAAGCVPQAVTEARLAVWLAAAAAVTSEGSAAQD